MLRRRNWPKNKYTCQPLADIFQTIFTLVFLLHLFMTTVIIIPNLSKRHSSRNKGYCYPDEKQNNRKSNNKNIPPTRSTSNVQSIKRRYFKPVLQEVRPFIKPKKRPNPKPIQNVNNDINLLDGCISKSEDVYWSILRYKNSHNQTIPAWKGFFHEVSLTVDDEYIVDYIPMIRSSPRIMETVKEVLVLCKEKAT